MSIFFRQTIIRITHWEYYPFHLVYFPIFFYWAWLMIKSRSVFFFNTANPLIKNGGFLMESKKEIYDFLPPGMYPKTILIRPGSQVSEISRQLDENGLTFPLVAKPDIGMRGLRVAVILNEQDLQEYLQQTGVEFLIQEYIPYKEEIGIFFCKMPDQQNGIISGIVGKEFLSVTGDGRSTIAELVLMNDRAVMQWGSLNKDPHESLSSVLPKDENHILVPYGNHSRGAKFIDVSGRADKLLTETVNRICALIPDFYYGRLDVKFSSWEELRHGQEFSIIELNGAGSEPTHMYDPRHSIIFAWKEIIRHLDFLYRISKMNKSQHKLSYMTMGQGMKMLLENRRHLALISG